MEKVIKKELTELYKSLMHVRDHLLENQTIHATYTLGMVMADLYSLLDKYND